MTQWDNFPDHTLFQVQDFTTNGAERGFLHVGRSTWLTLVEEGKAPASVPKKDSQRGTPRYWRLGDLRAWLKSQADPSGEVKQANIDLNQAGIDSFDTAMALVHAPGVEEVSFRKCGVGALTLTIKATNGKAINAWIAPRTSKVE